MPNTRSKAAPGTSNRFNTASCCWAATTLAATWSCRSKTPSIMPSKAGSRIRITIQLIEAATRAHLWAERFVAVLAGEIAPKLEQAEIQRAKRKPTESLDAYDCYLRGMARFHQRVIRAEEEPDVGTFDFGAEFLRHILHAELRHGGAENDLELHAPQHVGHPLRIVDRLFQRTDAHIGGIADHERLFNAIDRVADATGTPLEDWKAEATSDVRSAIGIDEFMSRNEANDRMN
jgi:hypothetical protein